MSSLFEHGIPYKYGQQDVAYKNFVKILSFNSTQINLLLSEIRRKYKKNNSKDPTIAWFSAERNLCDGIYAIVPYSGYFG